MITLTEIKRELVEEKEKYFKNYLYWGKKIKEIAKKLLDKDVRVLIFGSVVKGKWGPNSDIDVLVISNKLSKNWIKNRIIRTKIKKEIGPFSPFQIHLATPEEYKNWYRRFIKKDYVEIK
jgi:predicted nucleotidyltransferase